MRHTVLMAVMAAAAIEAALVPRLGHAQTAAPVADTRASEIVAQQAAKARTARPYEPGVAEAVVKKLDEVLLSGRFPWHPYLGTAYQGAGLTLGAGYRWHLGDYNALAVRGAMSLNESKRVETEFRAPYVFGRRAVMMALADWREGLDQRFYGLGTATTSVDDRSQFDFRQASMSTSLDARPTRGAWVAGSGIQVSRFEQRVSAGSAFARGYSAATLPGLGATVTYLQTHGTMALDWRPAEGYARRGGYYGVTARRFDDVDGGDFSFRQIEYEAVQHVPVLRDAWAISLRGRVETTYAGDGHEVPFFLMPALGNGVTLRGFTSGRFRDRHSLLLSAEWRVLINAAADVAFFYDAGKVTSRRGDLDLKGLKSDYGIGLRLHTLSATPLRIDLARSNEGFVVVFGSSAAF